MTSRFTCPVCGWPGLKEPPREVEDDEPSDEICPSCDFQFGYTDDDLEYSYKAWRRKWIREGAKWHGVGMSAPAKWDPRAQLERLLNT